MDDFNKQQLNGFTTIELLLVLIIIAAITFAGIQRYQLQKRQTQLLQVKQNVELLFNALNIYYREYCKNDGSFPAKVSMQELKDKGLMPNLGPSDLVLPWKDTEYNYYVTAYYVGKTKDTNRFIYQLIIKADLNVDTNAMEWYRVYFDATSIDGNEITWDRMPSYQPAGLDTNLWIMDSGLGYFKSQVALSDDESCAY